MTIDADHVAAGVRVNDVFSAEDRETFDRLLKLHVRLSEVVRLDAAKIEIFRAGEIEQILLRLQEVLGSLVRGAGRELAHVTGDESRIAVAVLVVNLDPG